MKASVLFLFLPALIARGDDSATLKMPAQGDPLVQVQISAVLPPGQQPRAVLIKSTDDDGATAVPSEPQSLSTGGGGTSFLLPVHSFDPKATYIVAISPLSPTDTPRALTVKIELTASVGLSPVCSNGLALRLKSPASIAAAQWKILSDALTAVPPPLTVTIHEAGKGDRVIDVRSVSLGTDKPEDMAANGQALACLVLAGGLPNDSYRATVQFQHPPRPELSQAIVNDAMKGSKLAQPDNKPPADTPGNRDIEKNLDASVMFTSSVKPADSTAARQCGMAGTRCNVGVLDLRLAPWLNILSSNALSGNAAVGKWIRLYTPFYIDAAVSTGPIDTDTVSQDRVIFGTEYEFRRYSSLTAGSTFQRVILRASHASDRDFKQKEYAGSLEYRPVLSALSRPIRFTWVLDPQVKDGDGHEIHVERAFGWDIEPLLGIEIGNTYSRRNPAAAVPPSPAVRRFYWGGSVELDVTRYLTLTGSDTFYVRGEDRDDRLHNHFTAEADLPFWFLSGKSANLFFLSYERGGEAPFDKPDVNSLLVGYKIQSQGWFGQHR